MIGIILTCGYTAYTAKRENNWFKKSSLQLKLNAKIRNYVGVIIHIVLTIE